MGVKKAVKIVLLVLTVLLAYLVKQIVKLDVLPVSELMGVRDVMVLIFLQAHVQQLVQLAVNQNVKQLVNFVQDVIITVIMGVLYVMAVLVDARKAVRLGVKSVQQDVKFV